MPLWTSLPLWYAGAEQKASATDLNHLRRSARLLDAWTYRNEPALDSTTGVDTNTPGYFSTANPLRLWWGAALMRPGVTSVTVSGVGQRSMSETLKVWVGGTDVTRSGTNVGTITPPGSFGAFSGTFTITGYSDGDVVPIEVTIEGAHSAAANYQIGDVYLSPVTKSGWTAPPSFASVADATNATKLTQLCDAMQWLYERIKLIPIVPRLAMYYNLGPFKLGDSQHVNRPMYYGSVGRYYTDSDLHIYGAVTSTTTTGWNFVIYLNSVLVYTSPTYGVGTQVVDLRFSLASYTLGSRVRIVMLATATNDGGLDVIRFTRWTFGKIHVVAQSAGWPYAAVPSAFTRPALGTMTAEQVRAGLASLSTIVSNAKARIDARPEQWAVSRAMRRHYTKNNDTEPILYSRARPYFWQRSGSELFVKGTDTKLAYGPITQEIDAASNGWEKYTFQHEEDLDATTGATFYLDDYEGLDVGGRYVIVGNPVYCAEFVS